jgi:acetyltransferase-like isoleucine patch superfamily enzyme
MKKSGRRLDWDWYDGTVPDNVVMDESAYVETSFSFVLCRSENAVAVKIGRGSSTYRGTMFDTGRESQVIIGDFSIVGGARIISDQEVRIGNYCLISWNVVLMDTYRLPRVKTQRREVLRNLPNEARRLPGSLVPCAPIRIGDNVWIGFNACILPGVQIGQGSIVGARSVVVESVPPFTIVGGNPARTIKQIGRETQR